jgi:periplasmic divalent cation tolerance protein
MKYIMIYITTKDREEARDIGESLVKEKLAACINVIPSMESIYWWKGNVEKARESVLIAKTKKDLVENVIKRVKELHSYDVPCVDVIPISEGNRDYFEWMEESLK